VHTTHNIYIGGTYIREPKLTGLSSDYTTSRFISDIKKLLLPSNTRSNVLVVNIIYSLHTSL
jgi:hypothetical protein